MEFGEHLLVVDEYKNKGIIFSLRKRARNDAERVCKYFYMNTGIFRRLVWYHDNHYKPMLPMLCCLNFHEYEFWKYSEQQRKS